jgi:hypothetical protein
MFLTHTFRPVWLLRLGLGFMFLYSGYQLVAEPTRWISFVPPFVSNTITQIATLEAYLRFQGAMELALALTLLAWFMPRHVVRIAALFALFELVAITLFVGIDLITFRDIGLIGAAGALLMLLSEEN